MRTERNIEDLVQRVSTIAEALRVAKGKPIAWSDVLLKQNIRFQSMRSVSRKKDWSVRSV
jgi:hypothetical protein